MKLSAMPFATDADSCGEVDEKLKLMSWPSFGTSALRLP